HVTHADEELTAADADMLGRRMEVRWNLVARGERESNTDLSALRGVTTLDCHLRPSGEDVRRWTPLQRLRALRHCGRGLLLSVRDRCERKERRGEGGSRDDTP